MTALTTEERAELERLRAWKQEAMTLFDGLQDLGHALDLPLGALVTGPVAVEAAEKLRAKVAAVEGLNFTSRRLGMAFDDPERIGWNHALEVCADDLRAALGGPSDG